MNLFINNLFEDPFYFFSWLLLVVFSVSLHEYVHAKVALIEGDDTAARYGHLTLNPFKQMGIFSLIMLCIIGFCWGSVPVNPNNFRSKYSDIRVSLAGPFTNLGLSIIFTLLIALLCTLNQESSTIKNAINMFYSGAVLNLVLFIFNMLPVPGFDGWGVVRTFIKSVKIEKSEMLKGISLVVLILALQFIEIIFQFSLWVVNSVLYVIV